MAAFLVLPLSQVSAGTYSCIHCMESTSVSIFTGSSSHSYYESYYNHNTHSWTGRKVTCRISYYDNYDKVYCTLGCGYHYYIYKCPEVVHSSCGQ